MIIGSGIDIIDNSRIKEIINKYGNKFIDRCFSKNEINISLKKINIINFFAKRYAAKEAFTKAIGTGFSLGIFWKDIEILNDELGQPFIKLHNNALKRLNKITKNKYKILVSLSDEKNYSIASIIISKYEK